MPPRPRARRRPLQRAGQQNDENVPLPTKEETGLDNIVPRTSTPSHPRAKPNQRPSNTISSLPPSSPPFTAHQDQGPGPAHSPTRADPFGFFAAERRLKERAQARGGENARKVLQANDKNRSEDALATTGVPEIADEDSIDDGRPAFATPPQAVDTTSSSLEFDMSTFVSGIHTPPGHTPDPRDATPRHRRPKRKRLPMTPTSSRSESPLREKTGEMPSIPATPSPMKRLSTNVVRRPLADLDSQRNSPVKKRAAKRIKAGKAARNMYKTDETLAEEELKGMADELKELLPSRPKRKAAQRKSDAGASKKVATPKKGKKAKPRSKRTNTRPEEEAEEVVMKDGESFVLSGEEREQFEVEREGRKEYFRGVDEYVMDEESVYII